MRHFAAFTQAAHGLPCEHECLRTEILCLSFLCVNF